MTVVLNARDDVNLETLQRVARDGEPVELGAAAIKRMTETREAFLGLVANEPERHIYGVTTNFGDGAKKLLDPSERDVLAKSPAPIEGIGFGPRLEDHVVRSLIFAKLTNLVSGHAAVSLGTARRIVRMLDGRELPVVPAYGQDSAGELTQQYNLYHAIHGEAAELKDVNVLTNGSPCAAGLIGDVALDARIRLSNATRIFALSIEAAGFPFEPYDPAWKELFGDPYESAAIDALRLLLQDTPNVERRTYQAPVSWRTLVRVLGIGFRCVHAVEDAANTSLRSVTDNPVYLPPDEKHPNGHTLQSGGFHNCLAYHAMNWLNAAWVDFTVIATRHVEQLHVPSVTGLARYLAPGGEPRTRYLESSSLNASMDAQEQAAPATIPLHRSSGRS